MTRLHQLHAAAFDPAVDLASSFPPALIAHAGTDWGDVATWFTGIATALAVAFAAWSYVKSNRDKRAGEAARVAAWFTTFRYSTKPEESSGMAVIYNGSDLPIYDASLRLLPWDWKPKTKFKDGVAPLDGCTFPVVRPRSSTEPVEMCEGLKYPAPPEQGRRREIRPPLQVEFTVADGSRWLRQPDGKLRRLEPPSR